MIAAADTFGFETGRYAFGKLGVEVGLIALGRRLLELNNAYCDGVR